jgi:hypothetical protein
MGKKGIRWGVAAAAIAVAIVAVDLAVVVTHWPFTRSRVIQALRQEAGGEVTIRDFRQTFFPQPGCVARGVVVHHGPDPNRPPLITVDNLTLTGDYSRVLRLSKRLTGIRTEGMHIRIPATRGPGTSGGPGGPPVSIDRFEAQQTLLEFLPKESRDEPFVIRIHRVTLSPAAATRKISFETSLRVPEPPGEVQAEGSFGPWDDRDPYRTPVSGSYRLRDADLGKFRGVSGILNSTGGFDGTVAGIHVRGETDVPDFEVGGTSHRVHLTTRFTATVNGRNGDVLLHQVDARFLQTGVVSQGAVESGTASLGMAVSAGRIQDLLRLVSSGPPGLNGEVSLRFRVQLPPGEKPFLERLRLTGDVGIGGGRFTNPETQQGLEHISRNAAHGEDDPAEVLSDIRGRVAVADGVARLSGVTFRVPGASARVEGTYHLITKRVDLRGKVRLEEKLSETTKGFKSLLLKALDPFFRKRKHISVVPVRITGSYGHTSIGLDR